MLIHVNYADDSYDYIKDFMLDSLIQTGNVAQFRRSSGWVRVGVDPIRQGTAESYHGSERRGAEV